MMLARSLMIDDASVAVGSKDHEVVTVSVLVGGFVRQLPKSISNQYRILQDDKNGLGGS
jgi:hypothetical protein